MAYPSVAGPAAHFGSAALVVAAVGLATAAPAGGLGSATAVHGANTQPAASPAEHFGEGSVFKFLSGLSPAGPAGVLGNGTTTRIVVGLSSAGSAELFGMLDRVSDSLPPQSILEGAGLVTPGPAEHFASAELVTTAAGLVTPGPAEYFGDATTIHTTSSMPGAAAASGFGQGSVAYVGVEVFGISAAGDAGPIGPEWQRPHHMTGLVTTTAQPSQCSTTPAEPAEEFVNYPGSGVSFGPVNDACRESDYDPVKRLVVEGCYHIAAENAVKVSWAMREDFDVPGPYTFELYRGRAVNDDNWDKLAEVVDQPWMFDRRPARRPHERSTYYRLRIIDGRGVSYWSHPVSFDVIWNHYDWRLVREIVRKELLIQGRGRGGARSRGAGTKGWLVKAKQFGDPCPRCLDPETRSATDSRCPICLGTRVRGGYYDPLEYWVIQQPSRRVTRLSDAGDTRTTVIETVRALAHPSPEVGDIWISSAGDIRYEVQEDIERLARHRGVDIILGLRLMELPTTHSAYRISLEGAGCV